MMALPKHIVRVSEVQAMFLYTSVPFYCYITEKASNACKISPGTLAACCKPSSGAGVVWMS